MITTSRGSLYWEDKRLTMITTSMLITTSRASLYWEDKRLTMFTTSRGSLYNVYNFKR